MGPSTEPHDSTLRPAALAGVLAATAAVTLYLVRPGRPRRRPARKLEGLSVGVQGKRCLWRALQHLEMALPAGVDAAELEARALRQYDAIEERRRGLIAQTFSAAPLPTM